MQKRTMSPITATSRLKNDYLQLMKDPVPYVVAEPLPSNILEWHYVVTGPPDSPYAGGYYHGKLIFPQDFPFKPPSFFMNTPNGRFKVNYKLCLSISNHHPETWNPVWSVRTILVGLLSFMLDKTPTLGSIQTSEASKKIFAKNTHEFNLKSQEFVDLFPDIAKKSEEIINRSKKQLDKQIEITDDRDVLNSANSKKEENARKRLLLDFKGLQDNPPEIHYFSATPSENNVKMM